MASVYVFEFRTTEACSSLGQTNVSRDIRRGKPEKLLSELTTKMQLSEKMCDPLDGGWAG
jgi:hypothetical protein